MPNTNQPIFSAEPFAGYWEWDLTGVKPFYNPALLNALGYTEAEQARHMSLNAIVFEEDLDLSREKMSRHLADGGKTPFILEARCRHQNGNIMHFLFTGHSTWNNNGEATLIAGSFIDVTNQKEAQQELLLVKDFLSKTNEAALVGGWLLDLETNTVIWSDVTRKIFGVGNDYVPHRGSAGLFFKEGADRDCLRLAFKKAVENGIPYDLELLVINAAGKQLWTRTIGTPEFENGRCVRLYGIFQDINTRKRNEEELIRARDAAEAAVVAKSRFLSVMSHEIRTPMNAVIGFTNLLLNDARTDQQEYLNVLKFSADNLMVIINDILDINKIEAGKIEFEQEVYDLKDLLNNIFAAQQQAAREKDISLTLNFDGALPVMVRGDQVRLGQILNNLVNNAIKFTNEGGVTLTCRLINNSRNTARIFFEIKDTGIGIPANKLDHIFEVFSQASTSTTRHFGGTGLGLAISQRLVNLLGGRIKVTSDYGRGSCFHFELSLVKAENHVSRPFDQKPVFAEGSLHGHRILLVEDNSINVLVAQRFLERWGIICDVADNGQTGVEAVQRQDYDLVLMDMQMPIMDGYEAAEAIRLLGGKYSRIPIIALTASAMVEMKDKILASGMNDYISKPFKPEELYDKINLNLRLNR